MRVVHVAWLGHRNFGDDLMAEAVRNYLGSEHGSVDYRIWGHGRPERRTDVRSVYPFGIRAPLAHGFFERRALRSADLMVIGGGSILHSENSVAWKLRGVRALRRLNPDARAVGIGLSLGPFPSASAREACAELLRELDHAAFRDGASFEFADALDLPYEPVRAFDLAACYLQQKGVQPRPVPSTIRRVGISIKAPAADAGEKAGQWRRTVSALADRFEAVDVFSFCGSSEFGDGAFVREVVGRGMPPNVRVIDYQGDVVPFLGQIRACDFFVSVRLHGSILAYLMNIPLAVVSYHKKCDDLVATIGLDERYRHDEGTFDVEDLVDGVEPYSHGSQDSFYRLAWKNFDVFES